MGPGSQQLHLFRRAIRNGATIEEACAATGLLPDGSDTIIGIAEARIILATDQKNPPPAECFELIGHEPEEEPVMGRTARPKNPEQVEEVKVMDFDRAVKLYLGDIKPALSEAASQSQTVGEAYKAIKKECHIQPQSAKGAIKAYEMEEARRDDHLRGFCGMLNALAGFTLVTFHGRDLVDMAEGTVARPRPTLVTVPGDGDDFTEATEEELAAQEGRGGASNDADEEAPAEAAE